MVGTPCPLLELSSPKLGCPSPRLSSPYKPDILVTHPSYTFGLQVATTGSLLSLLLPSPSPHGPGQYGHVHCGLSRTAPPPTMLSHLPTINFLLPHTLEWSWPFLSFSFIYFFYSHSFCLKFGGKKIKTKPFCHFIFCC